MERNNCWEVKKCGREPGGKNIGELGICPAALPNEYDGINRGEHAGRFCWVVGGTYGAGKVHCAYARKIKDCLRCEFLNRVSQEEGRYFSVTPTDAKKIKECDIGESTARESSF